MAVILAAELALLLPFGLLHWDAASAPAPAWFRLLELVVTLLQAWPLYAVLAKRLQDRNHAATAALATVVLLVIVEAANVIWPLETPTGLTLLGWLLVAPLLVLCMALTIETGLRRGTRGPNAYGPDPLERNP